MTPITMPLYTQNFVHDSIQKKMLSTTSTQQKELRIVEDSPSREIPQHSCML